MGSLASRAQLWSRARSAHAVRARSPRRAFAHQASGGAGRARSHGALVWRHGLNARRGSRLRRAATSRVRGTRGMCPATASVRHAHVHLQPTYRFPMFDSLQLGKPRPGRISTAIGGEVSVVVDAAACAFFDDYMLARALPLLLRVAFRRRGAARRRSRRLWWRIRAAAIFRRFGRSACAPPAVQATLCGSPTARALHSLLPEKKCACEGSFCSHSCMPVRSQACQ